MACEKDEIKDQIKKLIERVSKLEVSSARFERERLADLQELNMVRDRVFRDGDYGDD